MAKQTTSQIAPDDVAVPVETHSGRPDAVKFPHTFRAAGVPRAAQGSIVATAEKLLGVDKSKGEQARCRPMNGYVFATREPSQKLTFPDAHELKGKPRYTWVKRDDGVEVGTLVDEAREGD